MCTAAKMCSAQMLLDKESPVECQEVGLSHFWPLGYLEACSLSSTCLLLDRHDLHDLILQSRSQKALHDLVLLDWHGEQVDLLNALDLALHSHLAR